MHGLLELGREQGADGGVFFRSQNAGLAQEIRVDF
jgi:hypothetical protein